jgi:hypothetical protein
MQDHERSKTKMSGGGEHIDLDALFGYGGQQGYQETHNNNHQQPQMNPQHQQNYGGPASMQYDPSRSDSGVPQQYQNPPTMTYYPPPPNLLANMDPIPLPAHLMQLHGVAVKPGKVPARTNTANSMGARRSPPPPALSKPYYPPQPYSALSHAPIVSSSSSVMTSSDAFLPPKFTLEDESFLENMTVTVSGVSLEPLSGVQVVKRIYEKTQQVMSHFLPCVKFLVECQQELRQGLELTSARSRSYGASRRARGSNLTPRQYYAKYFHPLPDKFYRANHYIMEADRLKVAVQDIHKLCQNAKQVEFQGCEVMKNTFLGGIKEGESWGLRKWLSTHGGARDVCNDLESILQGCQKLDRNDESTRKLSAILRPMAQQGVDRLKREVPVAYQKISTAHPYLPFFHRLESALKNMATFDPEDDDVICIDDDDEIEEAKASAKRKRDVSTEQGRNSVSAVKRSRLSPGFDSASGISAAAPADNDGHSDVEVWEGKLPARRSPQPVRPQPQEWRCLRCSMLNPADDSAQCILCGAPHPKDTQQAAPAAEDVAPVPLDSLLTASVDDDEDNFRRALEQLANLDDEEWPDLGIKAGDHQLSGLNENSQGRRLSASEMADELDQLAYVLESDQGATIRPPLLVYDSFWDERYANVLCLFASILRQRDSGRFLEPLDEHEQAINGLPRYSSIIRYPLCLRDIATALIGGRSGVYGLGILNVNGLDQRWNMWRGRDLIECIDLVFLNALAYNGKEKTRERSDINRLRRVLWDGVDNIVALYYAKNLRDHEVLPMRRGETSSLVVVKPTPDS